MPYLDLSNPDNYVHLCQLFFAAHPAYRPLLDAGGAPPVSGSEYRISLDTVREMAAWGRDRHLITRKDAARIVEHAEGLAKNTGRCFKSVDLLPYLSGEDMPHDGGTR
jgi:hypothetical protein